MKILKYFIKVLERILDVLLLISKPFCYIIAGVLWGLLLCLIFPLAILEYIIIGNDKAIKWFDNLSITKKVF